MKSPNDNIPKEQEKASGEALREPGGIKKVHSEGIVIIDSITGIESTIPVIPNNYDCFVVAEEIEIEGREETKLKQSLGLC